MRVPVQEHTFYSFTVESECTSSMHCAHKSQSRRLPFGVAAPAALLTFSFLNLFICILGASSRHTLTVICFSHFSSAPNHTYVFPIKRRAPRWLARSLARG